MYALTIQRETSEIFECGWITLYSPAATLQLPVVHRPAHSGTLDATSPGLLP